MRLPEPDDPPLALRISSKHGWFGLQVGKVFEDLVLGRSSGQQIEHIFYPNAHSANAGPSAALLGIEGDPVRLFQAKTFSPMPLR